MYYAAAGAIAKALALLTVPFLSRTLGTSDYGLTDLAVATAALLTTLTMFAGDIPAARLGAKAESVDERRQTYGTYVVAVTIFSLLVAVLLLPAASVISATAWSSPMSTDLVVMALFLVPISSVQAALVTVQRLHGRARAFAILATVDLVAQMVLAVAFVAMGLGPLGVLLGFIAGSMIGLLAAAFSARGLILLQIDFGGGLHLVAKGLPFLPAFTAFVGADFIARALVADRMGESAVGSLGVAVRLASVLALMSAAFQLAWGPRGMAMDADEVSAAVFGRVTAAYAFVAGCVCLALSSLGPEVVLLVSGAPYLPAAALLPGFAAAAAAAGSYFILAVGAGISGRSGTVAASSVVGAGVQVLVTVLLIPHLELLGVGIGAIAGRAVSLAVLTLRVRNVFDHRLWTASTALVVVGALCAAIGWLNLRPDETVGIRVLIATLATIGCAVVGRNLMHRPMAPRA